MSTTARRRKAETPPEPVDAFLAELHGMTPSHYQHWTAQRHLHLERTAKLYNALKLGDTATAHVAEVLDRSIGRHPLTYPLLAAHAMLLVQHDILGACCELSDELSRTAR